MTLEYSSTIRDFPLMFYEIKRTAILFCEGKNADEILRMSVEENIYQLEKEKRRRSLPNKLTKRLLTVKKPLWELLANGSVEEAKLVAFLALQKSERLVFEYMAEIYADKRNFDEITENEFIHFIDRKVNNSKVVAGWNGDTLKSLNAKLKHILCDAGLAKKDKGKLTVLLPIVDEDFTNLLDETDLIYAKAMGVVKK